MKNRNDYIRALTSKRGSMKKSHIISLALATDVINSLTTLAEEI